MHPCRYDGSRPTLANMFTFGDLLSDTVDVQGFSHQPREKLDSCHAKLPHKPIYMSECCSCNTMRDEDEGCETRYDNPHNPCVQKAFNARCAESNRSFDCVACSIVSSLYVARCCLTVSGGERVFVVQVDVVLVVCLHACVCCSGRCCVGGLFACVCLLFRSMLCWWFVCMRVFVVQVDVVLVVCLHACVCCSGRCCVGGLFACVCLRSVDLICFLFF